MIVCLHGLADSPRTWDLVRPALERHDDVLAPALPGHLGGRPLNGDFDLAGTVEAAMDEAGVENAHLVGNSLGGYLALVLATRGRARSVVALAPAGGADHTEALAMQERGVLLSDITARTLAPDVVAHLAAAVRHCDVAPLIEHARRHGWPLDPAAVTCPVRMVWGLEDKLLPWPDAAARYRREMPHADWVVLDGVGHCPQLELPLETAELVIG